MIIGTTQKKRIAYWWIALLSLVVLLLPVGNALAFTETLQNTIGSFFHWIAILVGGAALSLGAVFLDTALEKLVVGMGEYFTEGHPFGQAITTGWILVRDLINMTFIFGLIYIGIKTILSSEDSNTRRQLGYLIIAALLINFSLFMTQLVVDFSNLLSSQIYAQLVQTDAPSNTQNAPGSAGAGVETPIAKSFLSAAGASSFLSPGAAEEPDLKGGNLIWFSLLMLIFFILAGVSFLMGAIMIVTRFVALILYMIFSPIIFLGWILPWFNSYSQTWWRGFFKQAFFAPIYIFLLYISVFVLFGLVNGTTGSPRGNFAKEATSAVLTDNFALITLHFLVMIGLLWASLKIGEKMSIAGGTMAMNAFSRTAKGMAGFTYRNTGGWLAAGGRDMYDRINRVRKSENASTGQKWAAFAATRAMGGRTGRRAMVTARNWSPSGVGRGDIEKEVEEDSTRIRTMNAAAAKAAKIKGGDLTGLMDHELVAMAKDPSKQKVLDDALASGRVRLSGVKAIEKAVEKDDGITSDLADGIKEKHKAGIKAQLEAAKGKGKEGKEAVDKVLKAMGGDAKAVGEALNEMKQDMYEKEILESLSGQPDLVRKLGDHIDNDHYKGMQKALAGTSDRMKKIVENDRFWG